ncbi:MAG TPA: hypothetical protein VER55_09985 [Ardenticatenaceae bacterium]|nr:hypothetical protein [Ardenticatenaceae bacterium]
MVEERVLVEWLLAYRWWIWGGGGLILTWLLVTLPQWRRVARTARFTVQRDYARWRFHYGIFALALLLPLVVGTLLLSLLQA